jgi:hypothetical protein
MLFNAFMYLIVALGVLSLLGMFLMPLAMVTGYYAARSAKADAKALADIERD